MGEEQGYNGYENPVYVSAIQKRLDTEEILIKIQRYLEGKITYQTLDEKGMPVIKTQIVGKHKCNDEGRQAIMAFVSSMINTPNVQGNYDDDMYYSYCFLAHRRLAKMLFINRYTWDVSIEDYPLICGMVISMIRAFMSRLINNKERESYLPTMKIVEQSQVHTSEAPSKRFGFF